MANPTLSWTVNRERGTISFGRLVPLMGNTYTLTVDGTEEGETPAFFVMNESGDVCLAKSETDDDGVITIAFNTKDLRDSFAQDWHEVRAFHCVCSNGTATLAEGDLPIVWNPVWTDVETGEAYSLRGPKGEKGDTGRPGPMGPLTQVKDPDTGLWYNVYARTDADGRRVLSLEQEDSDPEVGHDLATKDELDAEAEAREAADAAEATARDAAVAAEATARDAAISTATSGLAQDADVVKLTGDQTIAGAKTFTGAETFTGAVSASGGLTVKGLSVPMAVMPTTGEYTDFDLPDSESSWGPAPSSGWIWVEKTMGSTGQYITIEILDGESGGVVYGQSFGGAYRTLNVHALIPIPKGCSAMFEYTLSGVTSHCRFIKCGLED